MTMELDDFISDVWTGAPGASPKPAKFAKETDLCRAFIDVLDAGWTAYPETGGFDILLVRDEDGFQIGVEAKLALNVKVVTQAIDYDTWYAVDVPGPDCRAVLVPRDATRTLDRLRDHLGITVIRMDPKGNYDRGTFHPGLPTVNCSRDWTERLPTARITLPDWVPDVIAGDAAPVKLTAWKVKALKLLVIMDRNGFVTRKDFKSLELDHRMWMPLWLVPFDKGFIPGPSMPDFKGQHPVNFAQIAADYDKWTKAT